MADPFTLPAVRPAALTEHTCAYQLIGRNVTPNGGWTKRSVEAMRRAVMAMRRAQLNQPASHSDCSVV
jgi:hypothetical protein